VSPIAYSDIIVGPRNVPLIFAGPPRELTGRVELHNSSKVDFVVRDAGLKDPSGVLTNLPLRHTIPTLVLHPNQGRSVPLTVAVASTTAPGVYHAELDLGGESRPVVLHVLETFDLTVQPASILVMNIPGIAQRKQIIVTNIGNVAVAIGDIGAVDLIDDMIWDRAARLAIELRTEKAAVVDIEELVVAVFRVLREEARRAGSLLVSHAGGKVDVAPGAMAVIDLDITVLEELPHNSRFRGRAPLLTRDLEFLVVSSNSSIEDQPTAARAKKSTKGPAEPSDNRKAKGGLT
jgi:hypothetical protein